LLLRAMIPESWLRVPRSLEIRVLNPYGGASMPFEVRVKPRRQPAKIEIQFSKTTVSQKDQLEVAVHVTNPGKDSFLLPRRIAPFVGSNMLDGSYHFETKRPSDAAFADTVYGPILDGFWTKNPTEDQLLQLGQAVLVEPGERIPMWFVFLLTICTRLTTHRLCCRANIGYACVSIHGLSQVMIDSGSDCSVRHSFQIL